MNLTINGDLTTFKDKTVNMTVLIVLQKLGYKPNLVVVEFNGYILEQEKWVNQAVKDGDVLEIVTIVGGGS